MEFSTSKTFHFFAIEPNNEIPNMQTKLLNLKEILMQMGEVVVAYSGGVDSAFLLKVAADTLGNKARAVLATSPTYPAKEFERAIEVANHIGVKLQVIATDELQNSDFSNNPVNRCYFCKSELFTKISELASLPQNKNMVDGSNFDDLNDHRPGMKALKELGVRSPLQEAQLTKQEIRELSKNMGLPTWNKDAMACLSSRFPYGEQITNKKLRMVDEAEDFLRENGFKNIRARHSKETLKIEVDSTQLVKLVQDPFRRELIRKMKEIGYEYVTIDLEGYRMGSLNPKELKLQKTIS